MTGHLQRNTHKYPPDLIKSRLKKVKICKTLSFYNLVYGGTYYNDIIYLATHGDYGLFTDDYIARVFHHEFSSVLLQYTPFPIQKWMQANPAGFSYDKTSAETIESLQEGRDLEVFEKTYQQGLVDPYGATSYENDFNLYVEMVFVEPRKMAELIKKYPTIAKKYHLVKEFYLSIHPRFNIIFKQVFG